MIQNFEVILEQVLNHSVEFCYFFALSYLYKLFNFCYYIWLLLA
jgi:hypothetical protein